MSSPTDVLTDALTAVNDRDIDRCLAVIDPDFLIHLAGVPETLVGRSIWRANLETLLTAFPDLRMDVQDAFGNGNKVAVRNVLRGTHHADFHGMPASGRHIEVMSNEIYRVEDGVIVEEWIVTDTASLFGHIAAPSTSAAGG